MLLAFMCQKDKDWDLQLGLDRHMDFWFYLIDEKVDTNVEIDLMEKFFIPPDPGV